MPWVQRDGSAKINGVYANQQPGYADEFLPDDDAEVIAFLAPPNPPPLAVPPVLVAAALNINVADNDITGIEGMFNIAGAVYLDVGTYMLVFTESQLDDAYFAIITGAPAAAMTSRATDVFVIETFASIGGEHIDPPQTSVQIYRIAT